MADEEKRITAKFILDSTGFNAGLQGVNANLKVSQSELKNASTQVGIFGKSSDNLKNVQRALADQVALHAQKVGIYRQSLEATTTKLTANIAERDRLRVSLASANTAYAKAVQLHGKESEEAQQAAQAVAELTDDLQKSEKAVENNAKSINTYTRRLNDAETELVKAQGALRKATTELALSESKWVSLGKSMESTGKKMTATGKTMSSAGKALTVGVTVPILAAAAGLLKLGESFDEATNTIRVGTGATGAALQELTEDFKAVYGSVPATMGDASSAIADLNTRLGLSGRPLQALSEQVLNLSRITKTDLSTVIQTSTRMFQDAGIKQEDYAAALDYTFKASQATGIGIARLQELMTQFGGPLRQMGFDWQTSAAMLGKFEKEGVNTELVIGSLRIALGKMAREGIQDPSAALQEMITRIKAAGTAGEANVLALEMFGAKAGPDMAAAIREGRLDLGELIDTLKRSPETINQAAADTETLTMKFTKLKNQIALDLQPVGEKLLDTVTRLTPTFQRIGNTIANVAEAFANLSPWEQDAILATLALTAAAGPLLSIGGKIMTVGGGLVGTIGKLAVKFGATSAAAAGASAAMGATSAAAVGTTAAVGATTAGIGGTGLAASAATFLLNPLTLGIVGIGAAAVGTAYLLNQKVIPTVDLFGNSVSDATKKSVGAYMDLDNQVGVYLLSFQSKNTVITREIADGMVTTFEKMGSDIKAGRQKHYEEDLANLTKFYTDQGTINTTEAQETLTRMQENNASQSAEVDRYEQQISGIVKRAADERRALTQDEQDQIATIKAKMQAAAIAALTESEAEQNAILERMRLQANNITTLQASEVIANSAKQRDETIRLADEQYEQTVATIARQRAEGVIISDDQARQMIAAAYRTKTETVSKAQEMHTAVVGELAAQNRDVLTKLNESDGSVKTWWQRLGAWFSGNPITQTINVRTSASGGGPVSANASGTESFRGGLTTLHERGYEVYDLPSETRIYNHEASEDLVMRTAEQVAKGVLATMQAPEQAAGSSQPVQVNLLLDGVVVARQLFNLQQGHSRSLGAV